MDIQKLIELHELARRDARKYPRKRFLYDALIRESGKHSVGIIGPRGAGKTVLLRQYALEHEEAFYLSADVFGADDDVWMMLKKLHEKLGYRTFLLDEIHFLADASGLLKRLYDFLDVRILFSSSVALAMHASAYDLSRRVRMLSLHSFAYREYLSFASDTEVPRLDLTALVSRKWSPEHVRSGYLFDEYLSGGQLPFSLEEADPLPLLRNTLAKIITKDIPSVIRVTLDELETIERLMRFIGRSGVDGINYSSLSRNLGITKYKAEQYVRCLEKAFVLHQVFPAGTNVLREPKILMAPPYRLLYRDYEDAVGGLREDYFAESMVQAGISFHYLKSTRGAKTPDFLIDDAERLVIEIGGRGKGREQFKGIHTEKKLVVAHTSIPDTKSIPLFMLGYLI